MLILLRDKYYSSPVVMDEDEYLERLFSRSSDIQKLVEATKHAGNRRTYKELAKEFLRLTGGDSNKALELLNDSGAPLNSYGVFKGNAARAMSQSQTAARKGIREAIKRAQKSGAKLDGKGDKNVVLDYQRRASALSGTSRLSEEQTRKAVRDTLRTDTTLGKGTANFMDNNPELVDAQTRRLRPKKQYIPRSEDQKLNDRVTRMQYRLKNGFYKGDPMESKMKQFYGVK